MSYKIEKMYISSSKYSLKCPYKMNPIGITVHNTANKASAKNEVSYMRGNNSQTSYHAAIDDKYVILAAPFDRNCWHAGDGPGNGNRKTIGIEICYSSCGGSKFDKAEQNAAAYIATLLKQYGWTTKNVYRHKDWSGKDCPHRTIDYGWKRFLNMIQAELDELNGGKKTTTSNKTTTTAAKKASNQVDVDGWWGTSTSKMTQKALGMSAKNQTGLIPNQPDDNIKYLPRVEEKSWKFKNSSCKGGSTTIKNIQKLVGISKANRDGWCGPVTIKAMQRFLKNKGYAPGSVDGVMGEKTVKAWQKYINKVNAK